MASFLIYTFDFINNSLLNVSTAKRDNQETLEFAETGDFAQKEINLVEKLVKQNQEGLIEIFNMAKAGKKIKTLKLKLR